MELFSSVRNRHNKERGFTHIEALVAMGIAGIIIAAITMTFITQQKLYHAQEDLTEMMQGTRAAMDMMSREVRMAGYSPTNAIFDGVTYNTTQIQIKADLNGDGNTTGQNESVVYSYDAANHQILRNGQPVSEKIQNFQPEYQKQDGTNTTINSEIRQIKITITGRTDDGLRTYALTSVVTPANLAYSAYTR
jgi:type IV pilus assembly protein PilW